MKAWISNISVSFFLLISVFSLHAHAIEKIATVDITRSGFLLNRATNTFDTSVTIKNIGNYPLVAPLRIALETVEPKSVSLYNIYGKTADGKPYVDVALPNFKLAPQESV